MTENHIPKSKEELISRIEREWSELMKVVDQLTPEQLLTPDDGGWTPKDNLAHLFEWLNILVGYHLDRRPSHEVVGVDPAATKDWDFQIMNEIMFERDRHIPIDRVLEKLKQTYADTLTRIDAMSYEELMQPRHADDPEKDPIILWVIGNTIEHFEEHRKTIAKMLKT